MVVSLAPRISVEFKSLKVHQIYLAGRTGVQASLIILPPVIRFHPPLLLGRLSLPGLGRRRDLKDTNRKDQIRNIMTLQEFIEKIEKFNIYLSTEVNYIESVYGDYSWRNPKSKRRKNAENSKELYIYEEWSTGGISGGSCWDDGTEDHHYYTSGSPEPDFESLDAILMMFAPNIGHLQYKTLVKKVVNRTNHVEYEYYGNETSYGIKYVKIRELYQEMDAMGLL